MKLHYPICGTLLKNFVIAYEDPVSTGYEAHCDECNKPVSVEDRTAHEQEGTVKIILS